jgi:hypothetical protein
VDDGDEVLNMRVLKYLHVVGTSWICLLLGSKCHFPRNVCFTNTCYTANLAESALQFLSTFPAHTIVL